MVAGAPSYAGTSVASDTHDGCSKNVFWLYERMSSGLNVLDLAQAYELFARRIPLSTIDEEWCVRHISKASHRLYERVQRWVDVGVAWVILVCTWPVWLVIVVCIKLEDRGPVFYRQTRLGKNRKPFFILKFRTMHQDAEKSGPVWAQASDTRVTYVGSFLRKTHLDELPQMINILKGEISLVGPRPERPEFMTLLEREIPFYRVRHFVQPGFTGWAQIKFRYARSVMDSKRK